MVNKLKGRRSWRIYTLLSVLAINALCWSVYYINPILDFYWGGRILLLINLIFVLVSTSLGILLIHIVVGRRDLPLLTRGLAYCVPSIAFILWGMFLPEEIPPDNQKQNLVSPSGKYTVSVPIENHNWRVSICNNDKVLEYKDKESDFIGHLNVYWIWDANDRLWLYNSDNGRNYCWIKTGEVWKKYYWGYGYKKELELDIDIRPPENLFPADVLKRIKP